MRDTTGIMARFVRIICALALMCVAFSHRAPAGFVTQSSLPIEELAQYVLPDGTLPVLCVTGEDKDPKQQHHLGGTDCEACRLNGSTTIPSPVDLTGVLVLRERDTIVASRVEAHYRQTFPPNSFPRGPPPALSPELPLPMAVACLA